VSVLFYRRVGTDPVLSAPDRPNLSVRLWSPARDGFPPAGTRRAQNAAWTVLAKIGAFAPPGLSELSLWQDGQMVHRMIVTPRWFRFPFMADWDLQLGDLWTDPSMRGQGVARIAIAEACRRFGTPDMHFWYVTDAANQASKQLAEACGFQLVGTGRRTKPAGISMVGRYRLILPTV
jgi:GNAT superfamily N-acetyltransferase